VGCGEPVVREEGDSSRWEKEDPVSWRGEGRLWTPWEFTGFPEWLVGDGSG